MADDRAKFWRRFWRKAPYVVGCAIVVLALSVALAAGARAALDHFAPADAPAMPGLAVLPGQTAVGTLTYVDRDTTFFATVLYSRAGASLNDTLAALDPFVQGGEPAGTLPCQGPLCEDTPVEQGRAIAFDHLRTAAKKLRQDLAIDDLVNLSESEIRVDDATILVVFGHTEARASPNGSAALSAMESFRRDLEEACAQAKACANGTIALSMRAEWNASMDRHADLVRPRATSVLGPLEWTATAAAGVAPDSVGRRAEVPAILFLPTSLLVTLLLGFLASFFINPLSSLMGGEPVLPTPLLGALAAIGGHALVMEGASIVTPQGFLIVWFVALYVLLLLVYRARPPGILDTFSSLWAIVGLAFAAVWSFRQLFAIRLLEPLALLDLLYGADLSAQGERIGLGVVLILAWCLLVGCLVVGATELYAWSLAKKKDHASAAADGEVDDLVTAWKDRRDSWPLGKRGPKDFLADMARPPGSMPKANALHVMSASFVGESDRQQLKEQRYRSITQRRRF